ncbi:MAG TPA: class I SAM-dependent methyltransferase [Bacteroidales bacterium]|mgnify:CR=1 FL=1|nr:class I SAM-dependent methyltransferase [Bacteroidales bacterium]HPS17852.1 class I SAM-dependent methyltransferase [Bacteroidales bacterium]
MSKLSKALKAFSLIFSKPYLLNAILDDEEVKKNYVFSKYNLPNGLPKVDITELFPDFEDTILPYSFLDGSSLPTDFALLRGFAKKIHCKDYFEIGTWRGESVAVISPLAESCTTLNLPDDEMRKLKLSEDYINMHRFFSKDLKNVTHIQANSLTYDFSQLNKKFDLIFIDGDHHSESIKSDTMNAFKLLKDEKSIIVWHDYGLGTETVRWNTLAGILDGCPAECRNKIYHASNTLCAFYTNEKLKTSVLKPNEKPGKYFSVHLKAHRIS